MIREKILKLKFRAFSSKQKEGFILYQIGQEIPLLILQDILFQLFQPLFPQILCPQIYFFSSTDQILNGEDLSNVEDFIYVHFLERVQKYKQNGTVQNKFRVGLLDRLKQGLGIDGTSLYIFSQKQYMMYGKDVFIKSMQNKIDSIASNQQRKNKLYLNYFKELQTLKDNIQMIKLKNQLKEKVQNYRNKIQDLQIVLSRYLKLKQNLNNVLNASGISIHSVNDLR